MAHDLKIQAEMRQRRLQQEREEEIQYSKKVKRDCDEIDRSEKKRARSEANAHARNHKELVKQLHTEHNRRQELWGREKDHDFGQMLARYYAADMRETRARNENQLWKS